ncbi:MAG: hypothetical protein ACREOV_12225 [Candidatus Dormibacteraceae bacterium]
MRSRPSTAARGWRSTVRRARYPVLAGAGVWLIVHAGLVIATGSATILILPFMKGGAAAPSWHQAILTLIERWTNWDGGWYVGIAAHGYSPDATAFFPLFPMLVRAVGLGVHAVAAPLAPAVAGEAWRVAALIVANAMGLAAMIAVAALVLQETRNRRLVLVTLVLLAAYPVAFYLAAGYTESTSITFVALTLLLLRRRCWWGAAAAAVLAALAHSTGVLLAIPIAYEYARLHGWWRPAWWRSGWGLGRLREVAVGVVAIAAAPVGLGAYLAYLWTRFGDPLVFVRSEAIVWGRRSAAPWQTAEAVLHVFRHPSTEVWRYLTAFDLLALGGFALVVVLCARKLPVSFTLYGVALVLLSIVESAPGGPDPITSSARYLLVGVPAFIGAGVLLRNRPYLLATVVIVGLLLQGVLVTVWLTGTYVE